MAHAEAVSPPESLPVHDYPRVSLISAGHLINDLYGSMITALTPYLIVRGDISTGAAGFILLVYLIGSSVMQPLFGLVSDRSGRRIFAVAGPLWVGVAAASFGWANNSLVLLGIAGIGGIGTAAFHPQAASMVNSLSPRRKGWSMSIFSVGGNIGFASGPIVAAGIALIGLHWTPIVLIPGIVICGLLARYAPNPKVGAVPFSLDDLRAAFARSGGSLALIVAIIAIRSGTQFGIIVFLPLYYHARGFPVQLGSYYAFVFSLAGALGGLAGGELSDRYGRKVVVTASLGLTTPLLALALLSGGILIWPLLALSGAALLASNSVTVVQGQEFLPRSTGIASGLTLGLGFGLSGVITSVLANVAQHVGITPVVIAIPFFPLLAAVLALLVPPSAPQSPTAVTALRPARE